MCPPKTPREEQTTSRPLHLRAGFKMSCAGLRGATGSPSSPRVLGLPLGGKVVAKPSPVSGLWVRLAPGTCVGGRGGPAAVLGQSVAAGGVVTDGDGREGALSSSGGPALWPAACCSAEMTLGRASPGASAGAAARSRAPGCHRCLGPGPEEEMRAGSRCSVPCPVLLAFPHWAADTEVPVLPGGLLSWWQQAGLLNSGKRI